MCASVVDLRRLRYFRAIAKCRSFSGAARDLNITQPALTHHMNILEAGLGVSLFERHATGVVTTSAGQQLLSHAETIILEFQKVDETMRKLSKHKDEPEFLRIGLTPAVTASLAPALFSDEDWDSDIKLQISETRSLDAHRLLSSEEIDMAVVITEKISGNMEPLIWDPIVLVSRDPIEGNVSTITCAEVGRRPLILPSIRRTLRPRVNQLFEDLGITPNIVAEIDGIDPRKEAVQAGVGDTITSFMNVAREFERGSLNVRKMIHPTIERLVALESRENLPEATRKKATRFLADKLHAIRQKLLD